MVRETLRNAARRVRSSTGVLSPLSQGVKITPPAPVGTDPASPVRAPKSGSAGLPRASGGAMTASRSHCRHAPAVSWLLATRYARGRSPGIEAIWRSGSVRLKGTSQEIQAVVAIVRCAWYGATAPEARKAVWRSGIPATTGTPAGIPSSSATEARIPPSTDPVGMSSGSRWGSRPARRTSSGT